MSVKLLTKQHLEVLSLKGGCTGSSESALVKMSNCWQSHATAQNVNLYICYHCLSEASFIKKGLIREESQ